MLARFFLRGLVGAFGFWIASKLLHGVHVGGLGSLLAAGLLLGIVNAFVRPILILITLPLTLITLGLFLLVVNGVSVWLVTVFIHGVRIHGPLTTILTALIISIIGAILSGPIETRYRRRDV